MYAAPPRQHPTSHRQKYPDCDDRTIADKGHRCSLSVRPEAAAKRNHKGQEKATIQHVVLSATLVATTHSVFDELAGISDFSGLGRYVDLGGGAGNDMARG